MKKGAKIALWVVGVIIALVVFMEVGADMVVSRMTENQVHKAITKAQLPYTIEFGHIHVFVTAGYVVVDNIHFMTDTVAPDGTKEVVDLRVDNVRIQFDYYQHVYQHKNLHMMYAHVNHPQVTVWMDPNKPKSRKQVQEEMNSTMYMVADTLSKTNELAKKKLDYYIRSANLDEFTINNAEVTLFDIHSKMQVHATGIEVKGQELAYQISDSTLTYCDSIYTIRVKETHITSPDGLIAMEAHDVYTANAGAVHIGPIRVQHTLSDRKLAQWVKEPVSWIDLSLDSVTLAPMNLLLLEYADGMDLPYVSAYVSRLYTIRNNCHPCKHLYQMPQEVLRTIHYPVRIGQLDAHVDKLDIGVRQTEQNYGSMRIQDAAVTIYNFSNRRGSVMDAQMYAQVGGGKVVGAFRMYLNRQCQWAVQLRGYDLEAAVLNDLIRPLVAIEVDCHVDSMRAAYSGDKYKASGKFMLGYTGIASKVHKEIPIPYKQISQNAGAIEYYINNLIPKANPRYVGQKATAYHVEWEWKRNKEPFQMYVVAPMIMGCVQTYLPGLFVGRKIKNVNPVIVRKPIKINKPKHNEK